MTILRHWLIAWLAGDRPVVLNVAIRGTLIVTGRGGMIANVRSVQD